MRTAVIYARVSSKDQERDGYSIPAQLKLLREYVQKSDFTIAREFVDVETAKMAGSEGVENLPLPLSSALKQRLIDLSNNFKK